MGDSFSSWLALREPADVIARSATLTRAVVDALGDHDEVSVLDLGTGTGSNLRYLSRYLPQRQRWLLVDRDSTLLAELTARATEYPVETRCLDLGRSLDPGLFSGRHLVTASALLDLVSRDWLSVLARHCRDSGAAVLFALTYNGCSRCSPEEPEDDEVRELLNRHQRANDHGFGLAAGPEAVECAAQCFRAVGYRVSCSASDWTLPPDSRELQRQLIEGWGEAAREIAPGQAPMIGDWLARRLAHVEAQRSRLVVCHEDFAGWLPAHDQK
jgi:hypothetical protein